MMYSVKCKMYGVDFGEVTGKVRFHFYVLCFLFCISYFTTTAQPANRSIQQGNKAYHEADFVTAVKDYQKALSADDKNAIARFNMANAFQHSNDAAKAIQAYDDAIKNAANNDLKSKAYYNKGLSQLQQKDLQAAMESFRQSLRLAPADNDARENFEKARQEIKRQQQQQQPKQDDKKKPPPPPKKQQQQQAMSRQMMEQKFKELQEQEKQLQNQIQKEKNNQPDPEKDW